MTSSMLKIAIDRSSPDTTLHALTYQLDLIAALTRSERSEPLELDTNAAQGLSDLTGAIADALRDIGEVDSQRQVHDAELRKQGIRHLRKLGIAPIEPVDLSDIISAFGEWVDSLPEQPAATAPRLTEPTRPAAQRRAG